MKKADIVKILVILLLSATGAFAKLTPKAEFWAQAQGYIAGSVSIQQELIKKAEEIMDAPGEIDNAFLAIKLEDYLLQIDQLQKLELKILDLQIRDIGTVKKLDKLNEQYGADYKKEKDRYEQTRQHLLKDILQVDKPEKLHSEEVNKKLEEERIFRRKEIALGWKQLSKNELELSKKYEELALEARKRGFKKLFSADRTPVNKQENR